MHICGPSDSRFALWRNQRAGLLVWESSSSDDQFVKGTKVSKHLAFVIHLTKNVLSHNCLNTCTVAPHLGVEISMQKNIRSFLATQSITPCNLTWRSEFTLHHQLRWLVHYTGWWWLFQPWCGTLLWQPWIILCSNLWVTWQLVESAWTQFPLHEEHLCHHDLSRGRSVRSTVVCIQNRSILSHRGLRLTGCMRSSQQQPAQTFLLCTWSWV